MDIKVVLEKDEDGYFIATVAFPRVKPKSKH